MKKHSIFAFATLTALLVVSSCKKDTKTPDPTPTPTPTTNTYDIPKTYNGFTNVDHNESTTIIGMTTELGAEINKGAGTSGSSPVPLDKQHLLNLLKNQGNEFTSNASYNTSGFQIESNCISISQPELESFIDSLVKVSNSGTLAASGVAGVGLTRDAAPKRYLLTANGINYAQIINKGLMCDLVLYQIVNRVTNTGLDNTALITNGSKQYTALEHNWDVAFGYWSVPDSFPAIKTPLKLWGSYSNQVDSGLHCNRTVMNAFLKGRAAIKNKDAATLQAQADIIVAQFDLMTAGGVCQELNEIKASVSANDPVKVVSQLSELRGFVMSMKNNKSTKRIITDAQIDTLLGLIPSNHWNVTPADLTAIGNYIAGVYGFSAAQMQVL